MPLPVVKEGVYASFIHRMKERTADSRQISCFINGELERIRLTDPVIASIIDRHTDAGGPILGHLSSEEKKAIENRLRKMAVIVYSLLESQAGADDLIDEVG